eukprot:gene28682-34628_t
MTFTKFRSRKLFLLLAFLLFDSDVFFNNLWSECQAELNSDMCELLPAPTAVPQDGHVWVVDDENDLCLGLHGFEECGELNLWHLHHTPRGLQLKHVQHQEEDVACLGRMHPLNALGLRSCKARHAFAGTYWQFDEARGRLQSHSAASRLLGATCIASSAHRRSNQTDSGSVDRTDAPAATLSKCSEGFAKLKLLPFHLDHTVETAHEEGAEAEGRGGGGLVEEGSWRCPQTRQRLPRNLDAHFPGEERQVLVGAGLFTKRIFGMNFKVYNLGWYMQPSALRSDASLSALLREGDGPQKTQKLFAYMWGGGGPEEAADWREMSDRSLLVKLAMPLKKEI